MSNNQPSASTDINTFKSTPESKGVDLNQYPALKALVDALLKIQAQIDDLQSQINAL